MNRFEETSTSSQCSKERTLIWCRCCAVRMEAAVGKESLDGTDDRAVLPLVEEALRVGKRLVETGRVRVSISTDTHERLVRETLRTERAEVERVAVGRELADGEEAPTTRQEEDGTVVVPVLEEILVVERRLVLREEIRLRLVAAEEAVEQPVTLRRQRAEVERLPASATDDPDADGNPTPGGPAT
jgi:stress response protein YsnF